MNIRLFFVNWSSGNIQLLKAVTVKITGPRTMAGKTHFGLVNLLYIIMFKIRKIKPNSGSVQQKPKSFFLGYCESIV